MSNQPFVFCPYCATRLEEQRRFARLRPVCPACGFVQFHDPKVAVIGLVVWQDHILLVQRGVDPEKGKWALPGGFMDAGEMPEAALARELEEEAGLKIDIVGLHAIFAMQSGNQPSRGIVLVYDAHPDAACTGRFPAVRAGDDVQEAGWFRAGKFPNELAFDSTICLLDAWQNRQQATT